MAEFKLKKIFKTTKRQTKQVGVHVAKVRVKKKLSELPRNKPINDVDDIQAYLKKKKKRKKKNDGASCFNTMYIYIVHY